MSDKLFYRIWGIAESMDWNGRFPRRFWRWLLRRCDRRSGYVLKGWNGRRSNAHNAGLCNAMGGFQQSCDAEPRGEANP